MPLAIVLSAYAVGNIGGKGKFDISTLPIQLTLVRPKRAVAAALFTANPELCSPHMVVSQNSGTPI